MLLEWHYTLSCVSLLAVLAFYVPVLLANINTGYAQQESMHRFEQYYHPWLLIRSLDICNLTVKVEIVYVSVPLLYKWDK